MDGDFPSDCVAKRATSSIPLRSPYGGRLSVWRSLDDHRCFRGRHVVALVIGKPVLNEPAVEHVLNLLEPQSGGFCS